jgi:hypothetical protein
VEDVKVEERSSPRSLERWLVLRRGLLAHVGRVTHD